MDTSSLGVGVVQQAVFVVRQLLAAGALAMLAAALGLLLAESLRRGSWSRARAWGAERCRAIASAFWIEPRLGVSNLRRDLPVADRR